MFLQLCLYPATRFPVSSSLHTLFVKVSGLQTTIEFFFHAQFCYPPSVFTTDGFDGFFILVERFTTTQLPDPAMS